MRQINDLEPASATMVHEGADKQIMAELVTAGVLMPASTQLGRCHSAGIAGTARANEVIGRELETSKHARSFWPPANATRREAIAMHKRKKPGK